MPPSTPSSDFLLQIAVPDVEAYEPFYLNTILALPGVYDVETHFVLRTMKEPGPLPVPSWRRATRA